MKKNIFSNYLIFFTLVCSYATQAQALSTSDPQRYLNNRLAPTAMCNRYPSFLYTIALLNERKVKTLVETGTARCGDKNFQWDGGSTIVFGDWASQNNAVLYSVDLDPKGVEQAITATKSFGDHVKITCSDSIQFLQEFKKPIDFLYLDSYDFDSANPNPSQEHHLKEIVTAYPNLHKMSVVLIDDCDLAHGGKGKLVIDYLLNKGWNVVFSGYQVILTQN